MHDKARIDADSFEFVLEPGPATIGVRVQLLGAPEPGRMTLLDVVTIHRDGQVEMKDGVSLDEASLAFWKAVAAMAPGFLKALGDSKAPDGGPSGAR